MARKVNKTIDRDRGAIRIKRELDLAKGSTLDVGYWGSKRHSDGKATIPYIASIHEFGTQNQNKDAGPVIPERSFMRTTVDENDGFKRQMKTAGQKVIGGASVKDALVWLGEIILGKIRQKITQGDPSWPQLADSTLARRREGPGNHGTGHHPLFDTGTLAKSGGTRVYISGRRAAETGAN